MIFCRVGRALFLIVGLYNIQTHRANGGLEWRTGLHFLMDHDHTAFLGPYRPSLFLTPQNNYTSEKNGGNIFAVDKLTVYLSFILPLHTNYHLIQYSAGSGSLSLFLSSRRYLQMEKAGRTTRFGNE